MLRSYVWCPKVNVFEPGTCEDSNRSQTVREINTSSPFSQRGMHISGNLFGWSHACSEHLLRQRERQKTAVKILKTIILNRTDCIIQLYAGMNVFLHTFAQVVCFCFHANQISLLWDLGWVLTGKGKKMLWNVKKDAISEIIADTFHKKGSLPGNTKVNADEFYQHQRMGGVFRFTGPTG